MNITKQTIDQVGLALALARTVKRRAGFWHATYLRLVLLAIALLGLGLVGAAAIGTAQPYWKIGRAIVEWRTVAQTPQGQTAGRRVQPAQTLPFLKLSLRNEGGAGNLPVQIFARWSGPSAPNQAFTLLGKYSKEVALTQTAIVEMALTPLAYKAAPTAKVGLEIAVMTEGKETDRKTIAWN